MGLPTSVSKSLWPLLAAAFIAWIVELFGLLSLHRSCADHEDQVWYAFAELPHVANCGKIFRYLWWIVWLEVPIGLLILAALLGWLGTRYNILARYRIPIIALLATSLALHMWAANVALNLTDSDAKPFLSKTEVTRARVALIGFCVQCVVHILTIFVLGDDGEEAAWLGTEGALGSSTREPLLEDPPLPLVVEPREGQEAVVVEAREALLIVQA